MAHRPTPLKLNVQSIELKNESNGKFVLLINGRSLNGHGREYNLVASIDSFNTLQKMSAGLKSVAREKLIEVEKELKSMI